MPLEVPMEWRGFCSARINSSDQIGQLARRQHAESRAFVLCGSRVRVMHGAEWLARHKIATLAWDLLKKDEQA
jgi:hypothetical protein